MTRNATRTKDGRALLLEQLKVCERAPHRVPADGQRQRLRLHANRKLQDGASEHGALGDGGHRQVYGQFGARRRTVGGQLVNLDRRACMDRLARERGPERGQGVVRGGSGLARSGREGASEPRCGTRLRSTDIQ